MSNQNEVGQEATGDAAKQALSTAIHADLKVLAEKHGIQILAAVHHPQTEGVATFYVGKESTLTQVGLAKLIEQQFIQ